MGDKLCTGHWCRDKPEHERGKATEHHQCQFEIEVHDDPAWLCRCCPECQYKCAEEV